MGNMLMEESRMVFMTSLYWYIVEWGNGVNDDDDDDPDFPTTVGISCTLTSGK